MIQTIDKKILYSVNLSQNASLHTYLSTNIHQK